MSTIKKDTLHPENGPEVDIYPKTSIDQVENLQANLDALNGDIANANGEIANANGEIANISANVETIANRVEIANGEIANISANVETIANRVEIAENSITVLTTAYESYTDYTEVTNGFLLTYLSGRQIELPIKAGTNVTFSKYPGSNQIIINSTGGSVPGNAALLGANNTFSGSNTFTKLTYFNNQIALDINPISFNDDTKNMSLVFCYRGFIKRFLDTGNVYSIDIPNKTGTIALTTDIPNYNSVAGVSYDTTNGAVISYTNGKLITIPIKAGDGVTIDADETNHNILISAPGGGSSTPQYNRGIDSATPTTFTYKSGVYHTLTITLLSTYVSTTIILPNDYDGSSIVIELEGKSFLIMVVFGLLNVRNTTDNTEWVGKLE